MCKQKMPEEIFLFYLSTASFNKGVELFQPQDLTEDVKSMTQEERQNDLCIVVLKKRSPREGTIRQTRPQQRKRNNLILMSVVESARCNDLKCTKEDSDQTLGKGTFNET